jgi:hypothetical protein
MTSFGPPSHLNEIVPLPGRDGEAGNVVPLGQVLLKLLPNGGQQQLLPHPSLGTTNQSVRL